MAVASLPLKPLDPAALIVLTLEAPRQPRHGWPRSSPTLPFKQLRHHLLDPARNSMRPSPRTESCPLELLGRPVCLLAMEAGLSVSRCEQVPLVLKLSSFPRSILEVKCYIRWPLLLFTSTLVVELASTASIFVGD